MKFEIPEFDHSSPSLGEAIGVSEEKLATLAEKANKQLRDWEKDNIDFSISLMLEAGLRQVDTIEEAIMVAFSLGSHAMMNHIETHGIDSVYAGDKGVIMVKSSSQPGEDSKETV
jgi:hypothetical protein